MATDKKPYLFIFNEFMSEKKNGISINTIKIHFRLAQMNTQNITFDCESFLGCFVFLVRCMLRVVFILTT